MEGQGVASGQDMEEGKQVGGCVTLIMTGVRLDVGCQVKLKMEQEDEKIVK